MAAVFCNFCTGAAPVGGFPVASGLYCASHGEIMRAVLRQATRTQHAEDLYRILNRPRIAGLFMRRQKSRLERGEATLDDPLRADSDSEGPADGAWVYWTRLVTCSDESRTSRNSCGSSVEPTHAVRRWKADRLLRKPPAAP